MADTTHDRRYRTAPVRLSLMSDGEPQFIVETAADMEFVEAWLARYVETHPRPKPPVTGWGAA